MGEQQVPPLRFYGTPGQVARNAVLFLAFIPGRPSITEFAAAAQKANKDLFVRGCVTSPEAAGNFYYDLKGKSPPKRQKGVKSKAAPQDARVISANALGKMVPKGWQKELLNAGCPSAAVLPDL
jgi:hypothetical protein